jgi:hypothetical protein
VVSHDAGFLDRLVDRVIQFEDRGFTSWDGKFQRVLVPVGIDRAAGGGRAVSPPPRRGGIEARAADRGRPDRPRGTGGRSGGSPDADRDVRTAARIERLELSVRSWSGGRAGGAAGEYVPGPPPRERARCPRPDDRTALRRVGRVGEAHAGRSVGEMRASPPRGRVFRAWLPAARPRRGAGCRCPLAEAKARGCATVPG